MTDARASSLSEFIPIQSLAKSLGVSKATVSRWRERGLPAIKLGNVVLFHEPTVCQWLKTLERAEQA